MDRVRKRERALLVTARIVNTIGREGSIE